jgi:hypothetical protein
MPARHGAPPVLFGPIKQINIINMHAHGARMGLYVAYMLPQTVRVLITT